MFAVGLEDTRAIRRDGLAAITLREVARRVGMRVPSLYTYFPAKNAMYDAMYADGVRQLAETLAGRPQADDPRETLRGRMRLFIAAAREIARILRPGGRLAFTTWERLAHPAGDDPQRRALASTFHDHPLLQSARADYRQLIENAGLAIETYHEPPGWRRQQQALAEGIIAAEAEVTEDMGRHYTAMARVFLADLPGLRYSLVTARRPAHTPG